MVVCTLKTTRIMRKALIFLSIIFGSVFTNAQNWSKEIVNDFRKTKQVTIKIDMSETRVMDVPLKEYPEIYSGKYSSNEKYAMKIFEKFEQQFRASFSSAQRE